MISSKNVTYIGKKTRKNKNDINQNLDEWITNAKKNANKDIEEKKCEDTVSVVEEFEDIFKTRRKKIFGLAY